MNKPKKPQEPNRLSDKEKKILFACGIFLSVFAVAILIFTIVGSIELEDPMFLLYAPGSLFMGGMAYYPFYQISKDKKNMQLYQDQIQQYEQEMRQYEKEHPYHREIHFYQVCTNKYHIQNTTVADIARMKLALKELPYDWQESELANKYIIGKNEWTSSTSREKAQREKLANQEKIKSILDEQDNYQLYIKKRLTMTGTDKRTQYLKEIISNLEKELEDIDKSTYGMLSLGENYRKAVDRNDSDWATIGGIAEGIAGPAAGLAAASQAYAEGEKERQAKVETADRLNKLFQKVAVVDLDKKYDIKRQLESNKSLLANTYCILTADDLSQNDLMELIKPKKVIAKQVVPGLISLNFNTTATTLTIYETVQAYIDGFFKVIVKKNGVVALENYYELSNFDGSSGMCEIKAYVKGHDTDEYTLEYVPVHLWAVEKR